MLSAICYTWFKLHFFIWWCTTCPNLSIYLALYYFGKNIYNKK